MKTISNSRFVILSGFGIALLVTAAFILVFAGIATAGPQADSMAFLPFVTGSAAATPVDSYETSFTDSIEPWKAVRS